MSSVLAICTKTGIITTTTGVLDTMADEPATKANSTVSARIGLWLACAVAMRVKASRAPVRTSAPITRNIAAMVQGAGFDSTSSAMS